ncbi:uncharacterized protein LOC118221948 isoform X2 [Anguilla anguilla]|uniref:uncharacterized protein LOC118221948 isoform X2 n=1 Tax=Anguilla anguilla TaxID=7936 RepID=UPI0015AAA082|nr:uncharacterized protein LOC118221948 isoform X2 [Anguilla anguilla]
MTSSHHLRYKNVNYLTCGFIKFQWGAGKKNCMLKSFNDPSSFKIICNRETILTDTSIDFPVKREKENTDDTIAGYIHRVSRIMTSAKCHRYFTATFQSREGFHRTVIFDVDRYALFQHASTNQTPVELECITKEHSFNDPSSFKIICNRETILTNTSVDFPVKTVDDFSKFTIDKIKTMPSKQPIPSIDAHVSALQPATSQVTKWGGDHEAKECWISDSTSSIQLTLWNKAITAVELQKSYRFSNLTTRQFLGETFLTITPSTKITPIDTLKNIHPMPTEGICNENVLAIEAEVTAVSITQRHICDLCHKNQATFDTKSLKNKCTECKMHQYTCNFNTSTTGVINCKAATGTHKLSLYTTAMNTYLQNNNLQHLVNDTGELENHFLDRRNFTFTVAQNVITHMQAASLSETPKPYTHTPPLHM